MNADPHFDQVLYRHVGVFGSRLSNKVSVDIEDPAFDDILGRQVRQPFGLELI